MAQVTVQQVLNGEPWAKNRERVVFSVDPGERHCGVAVFQEGACIDAFEMAPHQLILLMPELYRFGQVEVFLCEQFRLYPWMAEEQSFSSFKTVEVIGVLRYLWALHTEGQECPWIENPATIKDPTKAILKAKGIKSEAKRRRAGGHAADAELHGYYYLLHQAGERIPGATKGRDGTRPKPYRETNPKPMGATGAAKAVKKSIKKASKAVSSKPNR